MPLVEEGSRRANASCHSEGASDAVCSLGAARDPRGGDALLPPLRLSVAPGVASVLTLPSFSFFFPSLSLFPIPFPFLLPLAFPSSLPIPFRNPHSFYLPFLLSFALSLCFYFSSFLFFLLPLSLIFTPSSSSSLYPDLSLPLIVFMIFFAYPLPLHLSSSPFLFPLPFPFPFLWIKGGGYC